ncbi:MAG: prepilin-type N-terminal cleavage/methylation domain-containing protein [Deltaproteobacteria bacterium]|nr:prepilin-type N-terminal cleavage/methylation domain-containing protein [Deltaproteobacteria bacterium]
MHRRGQSGFTLVELLAAMVPTSVLILGAVSLLSTHNRVYEGQRVAVATEQNLRIGMDEVTDLLRTSGYGLPASSLALWVPWVAGFAANPQIVDGGGKPDSITVAGCLQGPALALSATAAAGATSLSVSSLVLNTSVSALIDNTSRSLILIDDGQNALVTAVSGTTVSIDTDPTQSGAQGLTRAYPPGTTICRVDVTTFRIGTNATTGAAALTMDANQGAGAQLVADTIDDLQISTVVAGKQFDITMSAGTNTSASSSLRSLVTRRN